MSWKLGYKRVSGQRDTGRIKASPASPAQEGASVGGKDAGKRTRRAGFYMLFLSLLILHLVLVSTLRLYPFIDLPNHLAAATIFRFYGDTGNQFSTYYSVNAFPRPNVFHLLFCGLRVFPSVETANRVFFCLYVLLLPVSVLLVVGKVRGNAWFSLLTFLAVYNFNVSWGFVGYTISIPFVFLLFYFLLDLGSTGIVKRAVMAVLFVLVFLMHAQVALFSLLLFVCCWLVRHRNRPLSGLEEGAVILPVVLFILAWWKWKDPHTGPATIEFLSGHFAQGSLNGLMLRFKELLYNENYHVLAGRAGLRVGYLFSFFIIMPVLYGMVRHWRSVLSDLKDYRKAAVYLLALVSFLCFCLLPAKIPGQNMIYQRFSVFFILSVIILGGIVPHKELLRARVFSICVLCVLHFLLWAVYFMGFQGENRLFTADVFTDGSGGKTLGGLVYDYQFKGRPIYIHFPNYHIVWNRGIASTSLVDYRFGCIRRKADERSLPRNLEWVARDRNYDGRYSNMDYIAVRGEVPASALEQFTGFRLSKSVGAWSLYAREDGGG